MKTKVITKYHDSMRTEHGFHRYNSWEYCYKEFSRVSSSTNRDIDILSLNLAAYLASWGMYRGSAFLLEFDYKVHGGVVKLILKHKKSLHGLKLIDFPRCAVEIMALHEEICHYYNETLGTYKKAGKTKPVKTSEVLSTKIMLGTLGCIPAYDRFLKIGLRESHLSQIFSQKGIEETLFGFASSNKILFDESEYPPMKVLDMYFFQLGYDFEEKTKTNK